MSGIIHINGKNYDEEGNLIPSKKSSPKFIDGFTPLKTNTTKQPQISPVHKIHKEITPATTKREVVRPPTTGLQRSTTLLRSAVRKPSDLSKNTEQSSRTPIIKHRTFDINSASQHAKHHQVQRLAKIPASVSTVHIETEHHSPLSYVPRKKSETMIQAQLDAATAHLASYKKPKITHRIRKHLDNVSPTRRRFTISSAGAFAILLVAGTLIYINLASISLSIASKKAGFGALLPSYTPNGFHIKTPIGYTPGRIIISFKSNSNDMNYSIEQKPTGWNSDVLKDQVMASNGTQYQTKLVNGLTVYFTNENKATWVDRGILFTLQGNSGLSSDQIASIAASM